MSQQQTPTTSRISCVSCRNLHRKCDRAMPVCGHCAKMSHECIYAPRKKREDFNTQPTSTTTTSTTTTATITPTTTSNHSQTTVLSETSSSVVISNKCTNLEQLLMKVFQNALQPSVSRGVPSVKIDKNFHVTVSRAQWHAIWGMALRYVPVTNTSSLHLVCKGIVKQLKLFHSDYSAGMIPFEDFTQSFSRMHLEETADNLITQAKEAVLHPDIFPHIISDATLAHTCVFVGIRSILNKNYGETKLFTGAVKVFLKEAQSILDVNLSTVSQSDRQRLEKLQSITVAVATAFYGSRMILFFNEPKQNYDNLCQVVYSAFRIYICCLRARSDTVVIAEIVKQYQHTLKLETGITHTMKLLECLDIMIDHIGYITFMDYSTVWMLAFYGLKLYATITRLDTFRNDEITYRTLYNLRNEYANTITNFAKNHLASMLFSGPAMYQLFATVSNIHLGLCMDVLIDQNQDNEQEVLAQLLDYLQSDLAIISAIQEHYLIEELQELVQVLQSRIDMLLSRIVSSTTASAMSPLSFFLSSMD